MSLRHNQKSRSTCVVRLKPWPETKANQLCGMVVTSSVARIKVGDHLLGCQNRVVNLWLRRLVRPQASQPGA